MKNYNKILEAVNRGIQLALDDFDDDQVQNIKSKQVQNRDYTKEYLDLMKIVVDLGLPSGTLWCKYNLGCDYDLLTNQPENTKAKDWYGDYYAWGAIQPDKYKEYSNNTYKFLKDNKLIKYNDEDNLTQLLPEDDAAYQNMHVGNFKFHIPTLQQFKELINYTTISYIKSDDIKDLKGWVFTGKNKKEIFFPAAGYYDEHKLRYKNYLHYWSSTLFVMSDMILNPPTHQAHFLGYLNGIFRRIGVGEKYVISRTVGMPIRPVINL